MLSVCASSYDQVYRPSIHLKGRQHGIKFAEAVIDLLIDLRPDSGMLVVSRMFIHVSSSAQKAK